MLAGSKIEKPGGDLEEHTLDLNDPFFTMQVFSVLENNGKMDPEKLEDYLARNGYRALRKALGMSAEEICQEVLASGLRGRGGAGFPTGLKWDLTRKVQSDVKYVICNGDEGDPGAFMDGSVLEGDPHAVIEGMLIAARAMHATHGVFYIRAEYPLAVERVEKALRQARAAGLVGKNVLDSGWAFDFEMRLGAGAFVCGEETALIASIEGKRGTPRPRPPFPAVKGLWDQPSCINNVETLANVPLILLRGAKWFASRGTEESKGHQAVRADRQEQEQRPGGGADGHDAARCGGEDRRRHGQRPEDQGHPDRGAVGRHDSRARVRHAGELREPA